MPEVEQTAATPTPKRTRKRRIPVLTESIVSALLDAKVPQRSIEKATGVNRTTIRKINSQELASNEQAERIKKGLRNRWALLADQSLSCLTSDKLSEASAKDLAYIAAKATEMAGLSPPSIVETYTKSIQSFLVPETPQQVVGQETHTVTVSQPAENITG